MGVLDDIGAFGVGLTQGAGQGLDLYQRFQDVQDKNKERYRKQEFEKRAIALAQDPKFKDDPIGLSTGLADASLELGDFDGYDKWTQAANSARNLKVQKLGMSAFAKARVNPQAAIGDINEMFKAFGNNNSISVQQSPAGMRLNFNVDGQNYSTDYTPADNDKFEHDILSMMEGYVMKPEDLGKLEVERGRAAVQERNAASEIARRDALLPTEIAENKAQTTSALAQAGAANERATSERLGRDLQQRDTESQIAYRGVLADVAQNPRAAKPAPATAEDTIKDLTATPDALGMGGGNPLSTDQMFLGGLAKDLRDANPAIGDSGSAYTAYSLTQIPTDQWAQIATTLNSETAAKEGVIKLPNGTTIPYTPKIFNSLAQIIRSAAQVEP